METDLSSQLDSLTDQLSRVSEEKEETERRKNAEMNEMHKHLIGKLSSIASLNKF